MTSPARTSVPLTRQASKPAVELDKEQISRRAYALYEKRGRENGHDIEDWLQAESEIARQEGKRAAA